MLTIADGRLAFRATKPGGGAEERERGSGECFQRRGCIPRALKPHDFCATSVMIAGAWLGRVSRSIEERLDVVQARSEMRNGGVR